MVEVVVFDDAVGPEPLHQLVFADKAAVVFDEDAEGVEDLGTKRNQLAGARQAAFGDVQMKWFKTKEHDLHRQLRVLVRGLKRAIPTAADYTVNPTGRPRHNSVFRAS